MKAAHLTKETVLDMGVTDRGFPHFEVGDRIEVGQFVTEGNKERVQKFEGDVIAFHRKGIGTTFTVRRICSNSIGVERIYPYYAPIIESIKLLKQGLVRRAKLFYLRDRVGKSARIKTRDKIVVRKK